MAPILISKFGISLVVPGDRILIRWPFFSKPIIHSYSYNKDFNRIWDYITFIRFIKNPKGPRILPKDMISSDSGTIIGVSLENVFGQWLYVNFPHEYIILLRNISIAGRGVEFWVKLSRDKVLPFAYKEFVILRCKDKKSAINILRDIPVTFAEAILFEDSIPYDYNYQPKE